MVVYGTSRCAAISVWASGRRRKGDGEMPPADKIFAYGMGPASQHPAIVDGLSVLIEHMVLPVPVDQPIGIAQVTNGWPKVILGLMQILGSAHPLRGMAISSVTPVCPAIFL